MQNVNSGSITYQCKYIQTVNISTLNDWKENY